VNIVCYLDFISPFAYVGWHALKPVARELGTSVEIRPVLFAGLLNRWGQLGPAEIPPKREYIFKLASRRAHDIGRSLSPPPSHPFNPLLALRAVTAVLADEQLGDPRRLIDVLFDATWGGGPGVDDPEVVGDLLRNAGFDEKAILARAATAETKSALRAATDDAIEAGVFGVPTFVLDGELFWGADSLPDLVRYARGADPVGNLERWRTLPASAQRKR